MVGTEFHDQAKGFADALLASRTATILDRISSGQSVEFSSDDREVLRAAEELLVSCQAGHKAAAGHTEAEMGFVEWMEDLRRYENAFHAIVRSRLAAKEADVTKTLDSAKNNVEKLLSGEMPKRLDDVIQLFSSISEVNLDVAQDSADLEPQGTQDSAGDTSQHEIGGLQGCPMDNDRAIGDCVLRAASLRRYSDQIENEEFPCDEPVYLAKALANIAHALAEYLVVARNLPSYNLKQTALEIRAIDGIVKWLFEPLRYVEGAVTSKVPWSLVGPLQSVTTRLLPDTALILRPKWRYNYAVLMSDITATIREAVKNVLSLERINECFGKLKPPLHIISFPYIERRSVFLHAALGHEIGHLIAEEFIRDEKTPMPVELAKEIINKVQDDKAVASLFKSVEIIRQLRECAEYRKRAIQELGSDLVAVNIMGFGALFALDGIIGMRSLDDVPSAQNQRYPPRRRRIRLMLDEIEKHLNGLVNWDQLEVLVPSDGRPVLQAYQQRIKELQAVAASTEDAKALAADKTVEIAYRWVDQSLNALLSFVRSRCENISEVRLKAEPDKDGNEFASGSGFWLKACELATSRLGRGLPPNTSDDTVVRSRPASFEAIMNAGWLHLLSSVPPRPETVACVDGFLKCYQQAERLTLRALELSDVQVMYDRWRQQHERPG